MVIMMVIVIYNKGVMAMNGGMKSIMTRMMWDDCDNDVDDHWQDEKHHDDDKNNKVDRDDADNHWQSVASKIL